MAGTNLFSAVSDTLWIGTTQPVPTGPLGQALALTAACNGAPPATADTFAHGCLIVRLDSATGVAAQYQNTGSSASPVWTLIDTALPGDTASSLIDTNSLTVVDVATVASQVNHLRVTPSATGAVGANAVILQPNGTDAAISLLIEPLGVTGITTIGLSNGTGDIIVGSSSGVQAVELADGTGAATVELANTTTAGATVTMAGQATANGITDTLNIATGNTVGTGSKVVHIADGTPAGTNVVTIGSLANTANTTAIQGGNGATAITLTPQITGGIVIGAVAGTGAITVGSSSTTQTTNVGTGAGVSTINVATGAAANIVTMGSAASKVTTKGTHVTYQALNQTTGSAVANAPVATLTDAAGANVTVATGLRILLTLTAGLQAGANTLNLNAAGATAIKKHTNPANDIGTAYVNTSVLDLLLSGGVWQDMSQ